MNVIWRGMGEDMRDGGGEREQGEEGEEGGPGIEKMKKKKWA